MDGKYSDGKAYKVIAFIFADFFKDEEQWLMRRVVEKSRLNNSKVVFFSTLEDFYYNNINDRGEQKIFAAVAVERFDAIILRSESLKPDQEQLALVERAHAAGVPVITLDKGFEADLEEKIPVYSQMRTEPSPGGRDGDSRSLPAEMAALKRELHQLLKYQGDLSQMVVNIGTLKRLEEALQIVPEFMGSLGYKDFWFCANEGFLEKDIIDFGNQKKEAAQADFTPVVKVLHYHNLDDTGAEAGRAEIHYWEDMEFGRILPDLHARLEENDFLLVNTVHLQGRSIGYTAVTLDTERFWFVGYSAFLAGFRHLMELQRSQNQLMKMYMEDLLTGLYNRNGFYLKVNQLLENAQDLDLTIISLDMDGLKQINDTYGHAEGDEVLHSLGRIIQDSLQQELAARIGGDEFLVAFTGKNIDGRTREIIGCIEEGIYEYNKVSHKAYKMQASIGSYTDCVQGHTLDFFLKKADDLMYACKNNHKKNQGLI